tara:strand:+ start:423 stop:2576 length:2154 start_codon:yes stop_codon:yes gene_type:complete
MAKQSIGVGSASNDGTGDTLRQGAFKVNENFNEIYSIFGDSNNLVSFAKTSGISSDSNKLGGQPASFYTDLTNQTSGSLNNGQLPSTISGKTFVGNLTGNVVGIVTGSLVGTASSSVRSSLAYGLTATPSITVNEITASTLTGNVIGDITGSAGYATTAGLANYAFVSGLSTDSQRSVYSQLAGVSTISGYATTAGIATLAVNSQGLTGSPNIAVTNVTAGVITASNFKGDGSQITGVVASSAGILIKDNDSSIGIAATVNFGYGATVSPLSAGIVTVTSVTEYDQLEISGVSTFTGDIKANGNIIGDGNTVISGVTSAYVNDIHGGLIGNVITAAQPNITSLGTLTSLNVSGDVSIGGTLTYEDVTNIDSVGLITARSGMVATGVVTATSFSGPLIGNADTATSAGTATTASNANNIAVVDESTDLTCSVLYTNAASGYQAAKTGSNLTFDSVTGTLKPTNINATGIITASSFSGNATSATQATTANVASAVLLSDESSDTTCYPTFANSGIGTQSLKTGSNLYFNSNTGQLYATQFSGSGAGLSNIPASAITGLNVDARPNFQAAEYTTRTSFGLNSSSFTAVPGLGCVITPTNTNSKILINVFVLGESLNGRDNLKWGIRRAISGGATTDINYPGDGNRQGTMIQWPGTSQNFEMHPYDYWYVDTPGTTSAITYTPIIQGTYSVDFFINRDRGYYNYASYRVSGSRCTVMEVQP